MLTITPRRGTLAQNIGAVVRFDDGEVWLSDYRTMRAADGSVRFQITNTFLPGADILIDGTRHPLVRFRGFLGGRTILLLGETEVEVEEKRLPRKVQISFGRWSAEYAEDTFAMTVDVRREEPAFPFVLAGAHQLWAAKSGS